MPKKLGIPFLLLCLSLVFSRFGRADQSDFLSLCHTMADGLASTATCDRINSLFFSQNTTAQFAPVKPEQVNAPAMSIDSKIQFIVFNDPNYVPGIAYCYFVFRKWIDPSQVSPDQLGLSASGFAILNEGLKEYQVWLEKDRAGRQCKANVRKESLVTVANLEASLGKKYVALIALNPLALIKEKAGDFKAVMREMATTLHHERVHAYQVLCPDFANWSKSQWDALSTSGKNQIRTQHPEYNWKDPKVAQREYTAYLLENKPEMISSLVGKCRL